MTLMDPQLFAAEEWYSATYHDTDGSTYDIVIVKSYMHDIGYESRELANIIGDGETEHSDDLWDRVRREVAACELPDRKYYEPASSSPVRGDGQ